MVEGILVRGNEDYVYDSANNCWRSNVCANTGCSGTFEDVDPELVAWAADGLRLFVADGALSSGIVEGFNNKLKLITRKSYGFRTQEAYETALYHNLAALPQPEFTHRFF